MFNKFCSIIFDNLPKWDEIMQNSNNKVTGPLHTDLHRILLSEVEFNYKERITSHSGNTPIMRNILKVEVEKRIKKFALSSDFNLVYVNTSFSGGHTEQIEILAKSEFYKLEPR
jgi:Fe-S cluster assembly ATPase SufC